MTATSTERELQMKALAVLENHSLLSYNNSSRELSMFHQAAAAKCLSPIIRISSRDSSSKLFNKKVSSKSKKMIMMTMKTKPTKTHHTYFSSQITLSPTHHNVDLRKAHQGQPSVKVTNKMTRKMKAWAWVWATDKAQVTMKKMNQAL